MLKIFLEDDTHINNDKLLFEDIKSENLWGELKNIFIKFYKIPENIIPPLITDPLSNLNYHLLIFRYFTSFLSENSKKSNIILII